MQFEQRNLYLKKKKVFPDTSSQSHKVRPESVNFKSAVFVLNINNSANRYFVPPPFFLHHLQNDDTRFL